ncbi:uncharacterized protein EAE98_011632 [Botrytis deweyae]|uniref:Secreted protein n=1 Tax=Botrytis deweyae TaxID=2478750 RepID=A0ABQ7I568_9HELO|nr:uncharacterized protein EAE98_011632 [Botrytis deweyae]KAF7913081.1 hypothetical protein EAE98_011632 [Botrytis deweyae]
MPATFLSFILISSGVSFSSSTLINRCATVLLPFATSSEFIFHRTLDHREEVPELHGGSAARNHEDPSNSTKQ